MAVYTLSAGGGLYAYNVICYAPPTGQNYPPTAGAIYGLWLLLTGQHKQAQICLELKETIILSTKPLL